MIAFIIKAYQVPPNNEWYLYCPLWFFIGIVGVLCGCISWSLCETKLTRWASTLWLTVLSVVSAVYMYLAIQ